MKKILLLLSLLVPTALGFAEGMPDSSAPSGEGPKVLGVYHYTNKAGKVFEFRVVSAEDYKVYGRAYARTWSWEEDDCVHRSGDCMDDVVITPEN